jgi:transcriptional regulator of arginine metabolism
LIVAKTETGFAAAVCVRIDNAKIAEIVGTIAGEDTIFIAVRGQKEQRIVLKKVWELFEN